VNACECSFWALNLGLAWMVFANLFPIGVLQLADVVTNGYWHARSLEFFQDTPTSNGCAFPGDAAVIAGTLPLVYLTAKSVLRMRPQPLAQPPATVVSSEDRLFTEVSVRPRG
jgi:Nitric oxide reductase large subunit